VLNKAQDAVVTFLTIITAPIRALLASVRAVADALTQKTIPMLGKESTEAFDAIETAGVAFAVTGEKATETLETIREFVARLNLKIDVTTPTGGVWHINITRGDTDA